MEALVYLPSWVLLAFRCSPLGKLKRSVVCSLAAVYMWHGFRGVYRISCQRAGVGQVGTAMKSNGSV